ncbi:hypothetical protein HU200_054622 [Digitaria exilis]|uniref:F-box protein AT5G49610-like beta-propeller domain-containing protein n=1 Tax=Digitaria exilis TaxID=1010633 RepID=A0A835AH84_9POAL|nr:hypothetical protein HU200_054622 [Digitaria exilis]
MADSGTPAPRGDLPPPAHPGRRRPRIRRLPLLPQHHHRPLLPPPLPCHPPPPLLGFAASEGFHPAQPPHPSARLARAFADAADFSYSFVPAGKWLTPWRPRDVRQGRVLLECTPEPECHSAFEYYYTFSLRDLNLAVCDPLFRRYSLLPPIPKEIRGQHKHLVDFGLFLAPTGEDEDETAFRVVCMACNETTVVVFEFTSSTGQWHIPAYLRCSSLGIFMPDSRYTSACHDHEQGCFYCILCCWNKLLVLDVVSMDLSIVKNDVAKYNGDSGKPLIVLGRDGTPEVFFLADLFGDGPTDIMRITKQNGGGSSNAWHFENIISLPTQYNYFTLGATEGFLFLRGILQDQNSGYSSEDSSDNSAHSQAESPDVEYFSLDVKTREPKKVCVMKQYFHTVYSYFGYPLPLTKPTI